MKVKTVQRRGVALVYCTTVVVVLMGFISFAVDLGRVQLVKTQLQHAADAAARYAASGLKNTLDGDSAAFSNAVAAAADNFADGSPVVLDPQQDIQLVIWHPGSQSYTVTTNPNAANAVRVTARRTAARGNAVSLVFARLLGIQSCNVTASAIASLNPGSSHPLPNVSATSNPFLAGMPPGSVASVNNPARSPDYAPQQSPREVNLAITPGRAVTFDGINGGANNFNSPVLYNADGNIGWIVSNYSGNENGIANMIGAPINSLVGVFLDDNRPNLSPPPSRLDFTSSSSRDFRTLAPQLKQIFFIGDGRRSNGEVQTFIPPAGATRLFIGTWDGYQWNNNTGSFSVTVHNGGTVTLVD